jgi:hypothetical protein
MDTFLPATASSARKRSGSTQNECDRIGAVKNPQHRHGVANLGGIEEIGALDLHRNAPAAQLVGYFPPMPMGAIEHCKIAVFCAGASPACGFDGVGDKIGILVLLVYDGMNWRGFREAFLALHSCARERLTGPAAVRQLHAPDFRITSDRLIGAAQDRLCRAPVFGHRHALYALRAERL